MLQELPLDSIYEFETDHDDISFDDEFYRGLPSKGKEEIREAILNNINIQTALAAILLLPQDEEPMKDEPVDVTVVSEAGMLKEPGVDVQMGYLRRIFGLSTVRRDGNGEIISCQVSDPTPEAVEIFRKLHDNGELNPLIPLFYSDKVVEDCSRIALYQYVNEDNTQNTEETAMVNDVFMNYTLYNERNRIIQPGFPISCFSLQEIDRVPYIQQLARLVNRLFIIVSGHRNENGKATYYKYLSWDYLKGMRE